MIAQRIQYGGRGNFKRRRRRHHDFAVVGLLGVLLSNAADLNIDPGAVVLAGDSAGAQIAAQLANITTEPTYARQVGIAPTLKAQQLAAVLLLSGAYDIESVDFEGDYRWFLKTVLWAYSGTRDFMSNEKFRLVSVTHYVT